MKPVYITREKLYEFIDSALKEDIGDGDHTTRSVVPEKKVSKAKLLVKSDGFIAGVELARLIWEQLDPSLTWTPFIKDGDPVKVGDVVFEISGKARTILSGERLVLNCMQRMSGIATKTRAMADLIAETSSKILDTRKTTPNFRMMEKWAVYIGKGNNHRYGLYDMVLLKDNHIDVAGGIANAITSTLKYLNETGKKLKVEIETRNLQEVEEVVRTGGVDIIMLDNMSLAMMRQALAIIQGKFVVEASGNITEENIRAVAETGVDYISVGSLTHSYQSLDLSLKIT